jgi:hypothetical protein
VFHTFTPSISRDDISLLNPSHDTLDSAVSIAPLTVAWWMEPYKHNSTSATKRSSVCNPRSNPKTCHCYNTTLTRPCNNRTSRRVVSSLSSPQQHVYQLWHGTVTVCWTYGLIRTSCALISTPIDPFTEYTRPNWLLISALSQSGLI